VTDLSKWRLAAARLKAEAEEHDREWAERRKRRLELDQIIEARKAELRAARRAERAKELGRLEGVMKFVSERMAKPKEDDDAEQTP
jgi:hypothetical protein